MIVLMAFTVAQYVTINLTISQIQHTLITQSQRFLLGDLEIRTLKQLSPNQEKFLKSVIPPKTILQKRMECACVVSAPETGKSALVGLKAIDSQFPLYGEMKLKGTDYQTYFTKLNTLQKIPQAWLDPGLKISLSVKIGDLIMIGQKAFQVAGFIENEPGFNLQSTAVGPRIYIGIDHVLDTHLADEGTLIATVLSYKFEKPQQALEVAKLVRRAWQVAPARILQNTFQLSLQETQIISSLEKAQQSIRILNEFNQYLNLITVVILVVSAIVMSTLYSHYIDRLEPDLNTAALLGLSVREKLWTWVHLVKSHVLQGVAYGTVLGIAGVLVFSAMLPTSWGFSSSIFHMIPVLLGSLFEIVLVVSACLIWPIVKRDSKHKALFFICSLGAILISASLKLSIKWAFLSLGVIGLILGIIYITSVAVLTILHKWSVHQAFVWQYAIGNLMRFKSYTLWVMTCIGVGALCVFLSLFYEATLLKGIEGDQSSGFPDMFMIGIYDRQKPELQRFFYHWTSQVQFAPIIKSRLTHKNNVLFDTQQLSEQQLTLLEQDQNISYRHQLSVDETLVAGEWMKGTYLNEASVEEWFAKKLNIKLGDTLTLEIEGVPITVKVTSLRHVRWMSFKPNFFILLNQQLIQEAPKEWAASVSRMSEDSRFKIQAQLAEQYPNVTQIPLHQAMQDVQNLLKMLTLSVVTLSILVLVSGLFTLATLAAVMIEKRESDYETLKKIGFPLGKLKNSIYIEWLCLVGISTKIALILAIILGASSLNLQEELIAHYPISNWLIGVSLPFVFAYFIARISLKKLTKNSSY